MNTTEKEVFPFPVIRKRDGRMVKFDINKISGAIFKAFYANGIEDKNLCDQLAQKVIKDLAEAIHGAVPQVEEIQDAVERILIREKYDRAAKAFILYRDKRTNIREGKSELMDSVESILEQTHKAGELGFNSTSVKMMKIASAASRAFYLTRIIPNQFAEAHNRGDIHIHDLDYYSKTINSLQIPLKKLLQEGFYSGYGFIRPPKHFSVAGALTAIIIQSCQNDMHGGQSIPNLDGQLGGYIRESMDEAPGEKEIFQAMEGLVYNLNMMYSRLGEQVPMSTLNIGTDTTPEGRAVAAGLLQALENGLGKGETPLFPWVVFHVKDGINFKPGDPNYDLLVKAVKTASRRMNPSFAFLDAPINQSAESIAYWGDASRSASNMTVYLSDEDTIEIVKAGSVAGWGNIAQTTINMPRIAFKIAHKRKDFLFKSFYSEIRRAMELCAQQMIHRRDILAGLHVNELPFVMGQKVYKGSEKLEWESTIHKVLERGAMSIGFIGLAEALYVLFAKSCANDEKTLNFAREVIDFMNQRTLDLSREFDASFVLSASSSGYAAQRFPILDRAEFSIVPMVNDKKFYTQGFGLQVLEDVPWEKRLEIEGEFHNKVSGGHFTFLESRGMPGEETYLKVINKMKESGIAYGGISFPLVESLEDGQLISDISKARGHIRGIRRAAGLLLPESRINDGLKDELAKKKFDF